MRESKTEILIVANRRHLEGIRSELLFFARQEGFSVWLYLYSDSKEEDATLKVTVEEAAEERLCDFLQVYCLTNSLSLEGLEDVCGLS